jgi:L-amino acid N-acyltransferase YncA
MFAERWGAEGRVPPGYRVAVAEETDLRALLALAQGCFDYNTPTLRELRHGVSRGHTAFFTFRERSSGELVGYTLLELNARTRSVYANTTCIALAHRRRGLGRCALAMRRALASSLGYRSIRTHIDVDNVASLKLAQEGGYLILATLPDYYDNGHSCHLLRLQLDLPPGEPRAAR